MKMTINFLNIERKEYNICAFLLSFFAGIMYCITPLCCDDLWYLSNSEGSPGTWSYFLSTLNNCINHWNWDTGRLCNTVSAPFLSLFPRGVYAVITTGIIFFLYVIGIKITQIKWISLKSASWMFIVAYIIPWHDFMFTIVYSINYIWGAALGLALFYFYIYGIRCKSNIICFALFVFSIITGWWHEGLSFPLLSGLIVYQIFINKKITKQEIVILTGLVIGLVIIVSMPAFWLMTENRTSNLIKSVWWETIVHVIAYNFVFYLYVGLLIIFTIIKKTRKKIFNSQGSKALHFCILTIGIISTVIYIKYYNGPRTGMFSQLFCGLGVIMIFKSLGYKIHTTIKYIVFLSIFLFACISLLYSIKIQFKLSKEVDDVKRLAAIEELHSGRKIVFYDPTPITLGIDLLKPSYKILNTRYGLYGIELFPIVLKDFKLKSAKIKKCRDSELLLYNNKIIFTGPVPKERVDVIMYGKDGKCVHSRTRFREMITADGYVVSYVLPHTQAMGSEMIIKDAELVR